jgi:hypothetical protein
MEQGEKRFMNITCIGNLHPYCKRNDCEYYEEIKSVPHCLKNNDLFVKGNWQKPIGKKSIGSTTIAKLSNG